MIFGWVILLLLIKTLRSPQLTDYNFLLKKKTHSHFENHEKLLTLGFDERPTVRQQTF